MWEKLEIWFGIKTTLDQIQIKTSCLFRICGAYMCVCLYVIRLYVWIFFSFLLTNRLTNKNNFKKKFRGNWVARFVDIENFNRHKCIVIIIIIKMSQNIIILLEDSPPECVCIFKRNKKSNLNNIHSLVKPLERIYF